MKKLAIALSICLTTVVIGQKSYLQSGPMVGYSQMMEVALWVQTNEVANVSFEYWNVKSPDSTFSTDIVKTKKEDAFCATLVADKVTPGNKYNYRLIINKKAIVFDYETSFQTIPLWQYRTDPPEFTLAVGSCFYVNEPKYDRPGKSYGGDYSITEALHKSNPDLMIWLGDNYYFREVDYNSRSGMYHRATHTRATKELQPLLASTHHYAIWDDHDYGPNDHNKAFIHKNTALEVFEDFWANPTYGFYDEKCAVTQFEWGDAEFFMLDNRFFRDANHMNADSAEYFGEKQIDWLINALKASRATFKIIASGGQVISDAKVYENYANYEEERAYLLKRLQEEDIHGLLFLSGDRHHTAINQLERENDYTLIDFTISPLTSGSGTPHELEKATLVEETVVSERNYGLIKFSGKFRERQMELQVYDVNGVLKWSRIIKEADLK